MTELSEEVGVVLAYSNINPFDVEKVVAGWTKIGNYGGGSGMIMSGFIFLMKSGLYRYASVKRDSLYHHAYVGILGPDFPEYLIQDRAANWITNEDELNAHFPQAKSEAKNGITPGTLGKTHTRPVVRAET